MSIHPHIAASFVAIPTRRKSSFALVADHLRKPSPAARAIITEWIDRLGNLTALGSLLTAIALIAIAFKR
jgi:hypothetical protein